ncbi:MAG: HepT-like ribonuclease domain-containing protein [Chlorobium sp.]
MVFLCGWRMIVALRNRLIHGYLGVDNSTIWSVIQDEIPELLKSLQALKSNECF